MPPKLDQRQEEWSDWGEGAGGQGPHQHLGWTCQRCGACPVHAGEGRGQLSQGEDPGGEDTSPRGSERPPPPTVPQGQVHDLLPQDQQCHCFRGAVQEGEQAASRVCDGADLPKTWGEGEAGRDHLLPLHQLGPHHLPDGGLQAWLQLRLDRDSHQVRPRERCQGSFHQLCADAKEGLAALRGQAAGKSQEDLQVCHLQRRQYLCCEAGWEDQGEGDQLHREGGWSWRTRGRCRRGEDGQEVAVLNHDLRGAQGPLRRPGLASLSCLALVVPKCSYGRAAALCRGRIPTHLIKTL